LHVWHVRIIAVDCLLGYFEFSISLSHMFQHRDVAELS
jgi:hypothetical protein